MTTMEPPSAATPPSSKRPRHEDELVAYNPDPVPPPRTSSLPSPTMKLTGHKGSVYALAYEPRSSTSSSSDDYSSTSSSCCLVSASFDMTCLLWDGHYRNFNVLKGHKNAVLDVKWCSSSGGADADADYIATASADKTIGWWNANTGERVKKMQGHEGIVNAIDTAKSGSAPLLASASDDCTVKLWDARVRGSVSSFDHDYAVTAVAYSSTNNVVYSGGLDNGIYVWDLRLQRKQMKLLGHDDTITCLALHPKENQLLSQSMDASLKSWDVSPYTTDKDNRLLKTFVGAKHGAEKGLLKCSWSPDGSMVSGGSSDNMVHIWDEVTAEELYLLPGHTGCVNTVIFHPRENVIASGSSDKSIYVGELG